MARDFRKPAPAHAPDLERASSSASSARSARLTKLSRRPPAPSTPSSSQASIRDGRHHPRRHRRLDLSAMARHFLPAKARPIEGTSRRAHSAHRINRFLRRQSPKAGRHGPMRSPTFQLQSRVRVIALPVRAWRGRRRHGNSSQGLSALGPSSGRTVDARARRKFDCDDIAAFLELLTLERVESRCATSSSRVTTASSGRALFRPVPARDVAMCSATTMNSPAIDATPQARLCGPAAHSEDSPMELTTLRSAFAKRARLAQGGPRRFSSLSTARSCAPPPPLCVDARLAS